jgi:hypothetical protein
LPELRSALTLGEAARLLGIDHRVLEQELHHHLVVHDIVHGADRQRRDW